MADRDSTTGLKCVVVTPEETVLEAAADYVVVPLFDGELGIAPRHSPMIGRLGFGELRVKSGGETSRYFVDGGFVQVAGDVVSVMTSRAKATTEIDPVEAEAQLQEAIAAPPVGGDAVTGRQRAVDRARGMLR
ncbi:MAG: ATP synthase F1 subunit epsilon, partial [Planctomycetota bacterium]